MSIIYRDFRDTAWRSRASPASWSLKRCRAPRSGSTCSRGSRTVTSRGAGCCAGRHWFWPCCTIVCAICYSRRAIAILGTPFQLRARHFNSGTASLQARFFRRAEFRLQSLARVEQRDRFETAAVRTVAQRVELDADAVAGIERFARPSGASQDTGTGGLDGPFLRRAAALRLHHDPDHGVRVGPLKRLDRALQCLSLRLVVGGERMMRLDDRGAEAEGTDDCAKKNLQVRAVHWVLEPTGTLS